MRTCKPLITKVNLYFLSGVVYTCSIGFRDGRASVGRLRQTMNHFIVGTLADYHNRE
jgi:hypothetical protein